MNENQTSELRRLATQATAIVASILLAFSIDAWWDDRGERRAEATLLERLRVDFIDIQIALNFVDGEHRKSSDACIALLGFPVGETLPATVEIDEMVAFVFLASRTFNPGSGAAVSFLSSESGQLLHNQKLAEELLAWSGLVEELQEEEANLQKGVAERWAPFLASRVNVGPYLRVFGDLMGRIPREITEPASRQQLVVDKEFVNQVLDRYKWQQIALRDIEPLEISVENILALLEKELTL